MLNESPVYEQEHSTLSIDKVKENVAKVMFNNKIDRK